MRLSLRYKFILSFLSIEILFIGLIVFFNFSSLSKLSHSLIDDNIATSTALFEELIEVPMTLYDLGTLDDHTKSFTRMKNIVSVDVFDPQNRVLSHSRSPGVESDFDPRSTRDETIQRDGHTYRAVSVPIRYKNEPIGTARIVYEITESLQTIERTQRLTYFLIGVEILFSSFVAFFIGWRLTHDLNRLSETAEKIARDETAPLPKIASQSYEVQLLFDTLRQMQEKILERKQRLLETLETLQSDIDQRNELEERLVRERNFISTIIDSANSIIAVIRADGTMSLLNPYGQQFVGYTQEQIASEPYFWGRFLPPDIRPKVYEIIDGARQGSIQKQFKSPWRSTTGEERVFEWSNAVVLKPDGTLDYIFTIGIDVTETEQRKQEFETIFRLSRDGIAILDPQTRFLEFNDAYLAMTGFTREELLNRTCIGLSLPEDRLRAAEAIETVQKTGYMESFEKTCIVKNGRQIVIKMSMAMLPDGNRILISTKDITQMKRHEKELETLAHFDTLTGLPNRFLLSDRLQQSLIRAERHKTVAAVAYLDLDGFKEVNDRYGHDGGDELLIQVSARMSQVLREGDTLARLGGDEFVLILNDLTRNDDAIMVLKRLLSILAKPISIGANTVSVSGSIGITFYPQSDDVSAEQLIRQADLAMYEAKSRGKNQFALFSELSNAQYTSPKGAIQIKRALINGEFLLHYQPKVEMATGKIIGAEALIRWNDPDHGMIFPDAFLPLIDNRPLMYDVDQWVARTAMAQIAHWNAVGLEITVSINISAYSLKQPDFIDTLEQALRSYPTVRPDQVQIEILESNALHEIKEVQQIIRTLQQRGMTIALDDFGTGYSTLAYLKKLGIDYLKIDKIFVLDLLSNASDRSIISATLGLAEAFRAKVIAEGVESIEHGRRLLEIGCVYAQGYAIAKPLAPSAFEHWVREWRVPDAWTAVSRSAPSVA